MPDVLHYKTKYLNRSETFIDRLVRNHVDYSPSVLCYKPLYYLEDLNLFPVPDNGFDNIVNTISFHLNLPLPYYLSVIRTLKPAIIHAHFGQDAHKLIYHATSTKTPLIVSFYGSDVSRLPKKYIWKRRYKTLADKATHFIAASEIMKRELTDLGFPTKKISVVPFGLDLNRVCFSHEYSSSNSLVMVGRMVEKKGFEYAIRAIQILNDQGKEFQLHLFGDGPLFDSLNQLTDSLNITEQVHFHGYTKNDQILEILRNHALLLAPSVTAKDGDREGLPNTILEAMAIGVPVIATNHAAIPEAIHHNKTGFLVDERNPEQIAKTILQALYGKSDLLKIRQKARQYIELNHSVQTMVRKVETIYDMHKTKSL